MEPPVSSPIAKTHISRATDAAAPPEDPPATWSKLYGFFYFKKVVGLIILGID